MSDLITLAFQDAVAHEYRRAVSRFGSPSQHVNKLDAMAHAAEAIRQRIETGEIELPLEDAIHAALNVVDSREGQAADTVLAQIARGEDSLLPDLNLDRVVILGRGRRKAWRHVTAEDLSAMSDLRKRNTDAAKKAERRFLRDVAAIYEPLVSVGTIGALVASRAREARTSA